MYMQQPAQGFQQQPAPSFPLQQPFAPGVAPKRKSKKKKAGTPSGLAPGGAAPQAPPQHGHTQAVQMQGQVHQGMGNPNMYQYPYIPQGFPQQPAVPQQQVLVQQPVTAM
jgi:hypothetical protein